MSKLFAYAGTCVVNGATVYKFANDEGRAAVLAKLGATDVNMLKLPFSMGKEAESAEIAFKACEAELPLASRVA